MKIIRQKDAIVRAGDELTKLLASDNATPVLLLLSGGSSLSILDHCEPPTDATHLSIGVFDERFGEAEEEQNIAKIKATKFFQAAIEHGAQAVFPPTIPYANATELARACDQVLHDWSASCPSGKIIATIGVGGDGHVGGLIPPLAIDERWSGAWVIPHEVSPSVNKFPRRATVTFHFLLTKVDHAFAYMTGNEKRHTLETLLGAKMHKEEFPAAVLFDMRDARLFTDIL